MSRTSPVSQCVPTSPSIVMQPRVQGAATTVRELLPPLLLPWTWRVGEDALRGGRCGGRGDAARRYLFARAAAGPRRRALVARRRAAEHQTLEVGAGRVRPAQAAVARLALVEDREERRCDEDRGVGPGQEADEQGQRELAQHDGAH